jgi:hypothetical protein
LGAFGATLRRALDRARRLTARLSPPGRWPLAFAIAASLLVSALGPPAPLHADPPPDPSARLQIVAKSVYIHNDRDRFGAGEMNLFVRLSDFGPGGNGIEQVMALWDEEFDVNSGDLHPLERMTPQNGDTLGGGASETEGIPVYDGQRYRLFVTMYDSDVLTDDEMGRITVYVDAEHAWNLGTSTVRSVRADGTPGDYDLTFEIRRMPLPNLLVNNFSIVGPPGSELVCGQIRNVGQQASGPIPLAVRTEGKVVEQTSLAALGPAGSTSHCVPRASLPAHKHNLVFSLDEPRQIPEMEELDNVNFVTVEASPEGVADAAPVGPAPGPIPSPEPKPSEAQADLTVRAIRVNGQVPDGKNDCKDGKNAVTVVVKYGGTGDAGSFGVRLAVDGDDRDATVDGLDAGQEREVRFDDVRLKKGEHTLEAVADPRRAVDESNEDNNELKVTARCTDAG